MIAACSVPAGTTAWVLSDGKIGDEVQCFGIADALGLSPVRRLVSPRPPWSWIAPYGPPDPREGPGRPGSPIAPPFPDMVIASGRRTVPYLRRVKALSPRTFTVFSKDPRRRGRVADVIHVPEHDTLRGDNVVVTLTSPHRVPTQAFAAARERPDVRLAGLPTPRVGLILGGTSAHFEVTVADATRLAGIARQLLDEGHGMMVTPSRRTPEALVATIRAALADGLRDGRAFVWDGSDPNPYPAILALADALVVTGDSVNMLGEAALTGAPIHVVETTGGHSKITSFIDRLIAAGAARRWHGHLDHVGYTPIDANPVIARAVAERYRDFRRTCP